MNIKRIQVKPTEYKGMGIFALQQLHPNTTIFSIPQQQLITCQIISDFYQFYQLLYNPTISIKILFAYTLASLSIQHQSSCYKPQHKYIITYLNNLPQTTHSLICWSQTQLQTIDNKQLIYQILSKRYQIQSIYQFITTAVLKIWSIPQNKTQYRLFNNKQQVYQITLDIVLKYYSIIQSRGVYYVSNMCNNVDDYVGALVPVIDKLNHSHIPNSYVQVGSKCVVKSLREIKKGEEITVSYGRFSVDVFLQCYGFIGCLADQVDEGYDINDEHDGDRENYEVNEQQNLIQNIKQQVKDQKMKQEKNVQRKWKSPQDPLYRKQIAQEYNKIFNRRIRKIEIQKSIQYYRKKENKQYQLEQCKQHLN